MKILVTALSIIVSFSLHAQDSLLTYSRILNANGISKDKIYDRAMVWCGERFTSSKDAIRVNDKSSGIISGKARFEFTYMVPKKKDSATSAVYTPFDFNWIIECKDGKLRIRLSEIQYVQSASGLYSPEIKKTVYKNSKPPVDIMFMASRKVQMEWDMSIKYFIIRLDQMMDDLESKISQKETDW